MHIFIMWYSLQYRQMMLIFLYEVEYAYQVVSRMADSTLTSLSFNSLRPSDAYMRQ